MLDPRTTAVRRDLADVRLADRVFAPHYAVAYICNVLIAAPLLADPRDDVTPLSEILPGEQFEVLEHGRERAWGVAADGAVGYVAFEALGPIAELTHAVVAPLAQPRGGGTALPLGARLSGTVVGGMLEADSGSYDLVDLRPVGRPARDPVTVAERLVGIPFKAGGRSGAGVDDTGLVYLCMTEAGHPYPRFREDQAGVGEKLADDAVLQPGDLLVFGEHIGLVAGDDLVIHATPAGVVCEPLASLSASDASGPVIARRRP